MKILALAFVPACCALGGALSVNGSCVVGNCASPDLAAAGTTPSTAFNFVYTLANGDQYRIQGNVTATDTTSGNSFSVHEPFSVTYIGNPAGTTSAADTLIIDAMEEFSFSARSATFSVSATGGFGGPAGPGTSLTAASMIDGQFVAQVGPFAAPASFSQTSGSVTLNGLESPLTDVAERVVRFGAGSGVGAVVYNTLTPAGPGNVSGTLSGDACQSAGAAANTCGSTLCTGNASGGGCTQVACSDVACAGGGALPVLVFEGSGGVTPIAFPGSGGSGSMPPPVTIEGGGPVTPQSAGSTAPIVLPPLLVAGDGAGGAPIPIEILTPLETSAGTYAASAACGNGSAGSCWVTLAEASGATPAGGRAAITTLFNPQNLQPGTYTATITVTLTPNGGQAVTFVQPVSIATTLPSPQLELSQTAALFTALTGATAAQTQTVSALNPGSGTFSFTAAVSSSAGNWLSVTPATGSVTAGTPVQLSIQANPPGLASGTYSGLVTVSSSAGTQTVEVTLTVAAAPATAISSTGLVFAASAGATPAAQTLTVTNPASSSRTATVGVTTANGNEWLTANLSNGTLAAGQSVTVTVAPSAANLTPGVYLGTVHVDTVETSADIPVPVLLVVTGVSCKPSRLLPVITNLQGNFAATAGIGVPVAAQIVDDCGNPLTSGAATLYFPGGDRGVSMTSLGSGQWSGTWRPLAIANGGAAAVTVIATQFGAGLYGSAGVNGNVAANPTVPLVSSGGAVSSASYMTAPLSPGERISIFGVNLSGSTPAENDTPPYQTSLGGTEVLLGGEAIPLQVASANQINAIVPFDIPAAVPVQLIVTANGTYSMAETVALNATQPGVFTLSQNGQGAGAIVVVRPDGSYFVNGSDNASAGDTLLIYATGLGAVSPAVAAGSATPSTPPVPQTVTPVTVSIGGVSVQAAFAGLAPGFVGLYQLNVAMPAGVASGSSVPVVLSEGGAQSSLVTLAVQ